VAPQRRLRPCAKLRISCTLAAANTPEVAILSPAEQPAEHPTPASLARSRRWRRALLWGALLLLLGVAQTLLVALTVRVEATRAQDDTEALATELAASLRSDLQHASRQVQALGWGQPPLSAWRDGAAELLKQRSDLRRIERRSAQLAVLEALDTPYTPRLFDHMPRSNLGIEAEVACAAARRVAAPMFSRSYYVPLAGGMGQEVVDLCVPVQQGGEGDASAGYLVASLALAPLLENALSTRQGQRYELSFVEGDGTRLARAGAARGAGLYTADRVVDLPGNPLHLSANSTAGQPSLIPNLATALVLGLSIALFAVVFLLARDVRRRAEAERALAEALAFRKAMENSLITGLRARDLQGAITYVNPAFCAMVGFSAEELLVPGGAARGSSEGLQSEAQPYSPPYWPPEQAGLYQRRQQTRHASAGARGGDAGDASDAPETREGYETLFMRKNGERFPVMIYEAPLVDGQGTHTGWMSAVLDISAQRRVEEISRQQQDRLQATARLATVGEMASLMSHELNQPLAAIASYASGTMNLLEPVAPGAPAHEDIPPDEMRALLRQAVGRIAEQAERAGRIIKSVHGFVRRREQQHETLGADVLIDAVLPLVRLQARKSGARIDIDIGPPLRPAGVAAGVPLQRSPRVRCDRTMIEQVLINLARNGIQAMETHTAPERRVLTLRVRQTQERWVSFSILDAGPGVPPEVAGQLFTPFFTTRAEGMGLGLSLCRTVIEQHGGVLDFGAGPLHPGAAPGATRGAEFRFTLPTPRSPDAADATDTTDARAGGRPAETGDTPVSANPA
jgi:two-component system sensor histidine kinase DctS